MSMPPTDARPAVDPTTNSGPIDGPGCIARAVAALESARAKAEQLDSTGAEQVLALVAIGDAWRDLGITVAQNRALNPRPSDDDR